MKAISEEQVNVIFKKISNELITVLGRGATSDTQLNAIGKRLLGGSFTGVFSVEHKPDQSKRNQYFIINTMPKNHAGEHWMAVVKRDKTYYIYDSFGRNSKKIISSFVEGKHFIDADNDQEQSKDSAICGPLCLSFLICTKRLGIKNALKI